MPHLLVAMPDSPEGLKQLSDTWSLEIGRFMSAFATLEGWLYRMIQTLSSVNVVQAVTGSTIAVRANLIRALATDLQLEQANMEDLRNVLGQIEEISKSRNVVAHNGLAFEIYVDPADEDEMAMRPVISNAKNKKKVVTFQELEAMNSKALSLLHQCGEIADEITRSLRTRGLGAAGWTSYPG